MYDVAVIGGGAAGFFSALRAAELGCSVVILEKSSDLLAKVRVSGGGRCNVTHHCFDPAELVKFYPRGSKELLGPFTRFNPVDTVQWFEDRGVELKTEKDGRMFPVSDSSSSVINCFLSEANRLGVLIKTGFAVSSLDRTNDLWHVNAAGGGSVSARNVIVASGGLMGGKIPGWLSELGHRINEPVPSLFTFNVPDCPLKDLMGLSVPVAIVRIPDTAFEFSGPLLITHWGFSGPVILKTSAWAARWANSARYDFSVEISFAGDCDREDVADDIQQLLNIHPSKQLYNHPMYNLPSRLWERLLRMADIPEKARVADLGKKGTGAVAEILSHAPFRVKGKTTFKEEFVTCGGVDLKEINMKTMESKLHPRLFFAGELLDIDGITGGFNFQSAWTTGWLAGSAACIK